MKEKLGLKTQTSVVVLTYTNLSRFKNTEMKINIK